MKPQHENVTQEIVAATSALNTEVKGTDSYISEMYPMAEHSVDHMRAALIVTLMAKERLFKIKRRLHSDGLLDDDIMESIDKLEEML